jgi:uncharacterized protein with GYD domain
MQTFVMLTRLERAGDDAGIPARRLERQVKRRIETECPEVAWTCSYALLGGADYLDIFDAPDCEAAMKVALIVRATGHAATETWPATDWERFKVIAEGLS